VQSYEDRLEGNEGRRIAVSVERKSEGACFDSTPDSDLLTPFKLFKLRNKCQTFATNKMHPIENQVARAIASEKRSSLLITSNSTNFFRPLYHLIQSDGRCAVRSVRQKSLQCASDVRMTLLSGLATIGHGCLLCREAQFFQPCFQGVAFLMDRFCFLSAQFQLSLHHPLKVPSRLHGSQIIRRRHQILRKDGNPFYVIQPFRLF